MLHSVFRKEKRKLGEVNSFDYKFRYLSLFPVGEKEKDGAELKKKKKEAEFQEQRWWVLTAPARRWANIISVFADVTNDYLIWAFWVNVVDLEACLPIVLTSPFNQPN